MVQYISSLLPTQFTAYCYIVTLYVCKIFPASLPSTLCKLSAIWRDSQSKITDATLFTWTNGNKRILSGSLEYVTVCVNELDVTSWYFPYLYIPPTCRSPVKKITLEHFERSKSFNNRMRCRGNRLHASLENLQA